MSKEEMLKIICDETGEIKDDINILSKYIDMAFIIKRIECIERAIADLQKQEPKHGRWEEIKDPYGKLEEFIHVECGYCSLIASNYCPHCGAKMDGGDTDGKV